MRSKLNHQWHKAGTKDICAVCACSREHFVSFLIYNRNGINYNAYEPQCLNSFKLGEEMQVNNFQINLN